MSRITPTTTIETEGSRLAAGISLSLAGRIVGRGLFALGQIALARWLGPAAYGLYILSWSILQLTATAAPLGLDKGIIRYGASYWPAHPDAVSRLLSKALLPAFAGGLMFALAVYWAAPTIEQFLSQDALAVPLAGLALALPFMTVNKVLTAATRITRRAQYEVLVEEIARPGAFLLLLYLVVGLGWGLTAVVYATVISFAVASFFAGLLVSRLFGPGKSTDSIAGREPERSAIPVPETRKVVSYSLPTVYADTLLMAFIWATPLVLGYLRPASEVGIYQSLSQIAIVFAITLRAINSMFAPVIASLHESGNLHRLGQLYGHTTRWAVLISLPIFLTICFVPVPLIELLFGKAYVEGAPALVILAVAQMINVATGSVGYALMLTDRQRDWLVLTAVALGLNVAATLTFAPRLGYVGAAAANLFALTALNVGGLWQIRRSLGIRPYDRRHGKVLLAGIAGATGLAFSLAILPSLPPWATVALSLGIAGTIVWGITLAFGLDDSDRAFLARLRPRMINAHREFIRKR